MSNLSRHKNRFLINSVGAGTNDCETITSAVYGSRKVFIHKPTGVTLIGNIASEANPPLRVDIFPYKSGTAAVKSLTLVAKHNVNNTEVEFTVVVTRKAKLNGETSELKDVDHVYTYKKKNFVTTTSGDYDPDDVTDILTEIVNQINSDTQLNSNAILTGSPVTAEVIAATEDLHAFILLYGVDADVDFEIKCDAQQFVVNIDDDSNIDTAVRVPTAGKWTDIARIFPVRSDQAGTIVDQVIPGTYYTKIVCKQKTVVSENINPSASTEVEQVYEFYVPAAEADGLNDPFIAQLKLAALTIYKDGVAWTA